MTNQMTCPCCTARDFQVAVPRDDVAWETALREAFACRRTNGCVGGQALQDRTAFTHDRVVALHACRACGLLVRGDLEEDFTEVYAHEAYDEVVLAHFLDRDIRFFEGKEAMYRPLLPAGARVVEVGSYAGGFLHVAQAWGWHATGIDIGEDVARFANSRGYETLRRTLEACAFPAASVDGVFIWNCFDQLPEPSATLAAALRILRPGGRLVLRVPNALFYRLCRPFLQYARDEEDHGASQDEAAARLAERTVAKVMGYNNLLGFPYQYGYAPDNLRRLVARHGFEVECLLPSHLMMLPETETPAWALAEQRAMVALLEQLADAMREVAGDAVAGPWMELVARRPEAP